MALRVVPDHPVPITTSPRPLLLFLANFEDMDTKASKSIPFEIPTASDDTDVATWNSVPELTSDAPKVVLLGGMRTLSLAAIRE